MRGFSQQVGLIVGAVALAAGAAVTVSPVASADVSPPAGTPSTVTTDVLPTAQVDGVVFKMTTVGNTVFAGGQFQKARPAGTALGSAQEVARTNLLAFDIRTGDLLPFNHTLNGVVRSVVASPDGRRLFVGGLFTTVDGVTHNRLVAFDTATGAVDTAFKPSFPGTVRAIAVGTSAIYVGGSFDSSGGNPRGKLAAVNPATGALLPWAPASDDIVEALLITPDQKRVIVGGRFQNLNGTTKVGIGALDPATGALLPWSSTPIPATIGDCAGVNPLDDSQTCWKSWVTDLTQQNGVVYGSANGQGVRVFDGRFAAKADTGALVWLDNCLGATYGIYATPDVLYSVGHAHDCSSLGAFGQNFPDVYYRALAETIVPTGTDQGLPGTGSTYAGQPVPTLLHWFPSIPTGTVTGQLQGTWAVTGTGDYVAMGGEFPRVNNIAQQGLVRFAKLGVAPGKTAPLAADTLTPQLIGFPGRSVSVRWTATWDYDNRNLSYQVLRDGVVVKTLAQASNKWTLPAMSTTDSNVPTGSHTYQIKVIDPQGNVRNGAVSSPITILF